MPSGDYIIRHVRVTYPVFIQACSKPVAVAEGYTYSTRSRRTGGTPEVETKKSGHDGNFFAVLADDASDEAHFTEDDTTQIKMDSKQVTERAEYKDGCSHINQKVC